MKFKLATLITLAASPALAASKNPFSSDFWHLDNTDLIVLIAFIIFIGVLIKYKVPGMLTGLLDKRAEGIKSDLDEAKALREEAQTLLASYERKQREVQAQADRIVANAKEEAILAIREVRNQAVKVAVAAATDVIATQTTPADANKLIDDAIAEVSAKLH
jgi:F-type H+-transporting ATPase subunit b